MVSMSISAVGAMLTVVFAQPIGANGCFEEVWLIV